MSSRLPFAPVSSNLKGKRWLKSFMPVKKMQQGEKCLSHGKAA
jgi:hypothetical protein